ncbi:MAG: choice-of-anchor I family protein [Pseudomonadota bacterium]
MRALQRALGLSFAGGMICVASATQAATISLLSTFQGAEGNGEIVDFSADGNTLVSTVGGAFKGVQIVEVGADGSYTVRGSVDLSTAFGTADDIDGASSTALDPAGRGFGAVALIPDDNGGTVGKVALYDYRAGTADDARVLAVVDVGFHPDSVAFSADGNALVVANEGENTDTEDNPNADTGTPGSVSVIDLSSVSALGDLSGVTNADVTTVDFLTAANFQPGASIDGLRNNRPANDALETNIEPEFVQVSGDRAYVTLHEANAVAVLDLETNTWENIFDLGTIEQTVDASDRDGWIEIDDLVTGLPMPDSLGLFTSGGMPYMVTANEGDFHPEDFDRARIKDLGLDQIDPDFLAALQAEYGPDDAFQADENLGRLRISLVDGLNADGLFEDFVMPGTRSFTIWNAETGELVFDPGSLEPLLADLDPTYHNVDDGDIGEFDNRSDDKGPEPEALAVIDLGTAAYLAVGLERQNGIMLWDISNPFAPIFEDYINNAVDASGADFLRAPESLSFIRPEDSPTGSLLLLAGYEDNDGAIALYSIGVMEPGTAGLLGLGLMGLAAQRRRLHRALAR